MIIEWIKPILEFTGLIELGLGLGVVALILIIFLIIYMIRG